MENVLVELQIKDFNFDLIPLESDLLSLEMDYLFKDYYLGNDLSLIQCVTVLIWGYFNGRTLSSAFRVCVRGVPQDIR